jgi:hypothetical protein
MPSERGTGVDGSTAGSAPLHAADGGTLDVGSVRGADGALIAPRESSFVIESPDADAATVVYLFSKPVRCLDLSLPGWDKLMGDKTFVLEIVLGGKGPGTYRVTTTALGPDGASVQVPRSSGRAGGESLQAGDGAVRLESRRPRGAAQGSFDVTVGGRQWLARFDAEYCAGGHQP